MIRPWHPADGGVMTEWQADALIERPPVDPATLPPPRRSFIDPGRGILHLPVPVEPGALARLMGDVMAARAASDEGCTKADLLACGFTSGEIVAHREAALRRARAGLAGAA